MKTTTQLMTEGPIGKQILGFAMPLFLGQLFQQLYNTADSIIVGNCVDGDALAAVSSSGSLIMLLVGFFMGVSAGTGIVVSKYFGAGQIGKLKRVIHTSIATGAIAGVLLTIVGITFSPLFLEWMGTPDDIMEDSILYLRIYFAGSLPSVLYNISVGGLRAVGDSKRPLNYLIISSIVNVLLDLLFIAVFHWGVAGAALATILSQLLSAVMSFRHMMTTQEIYRIELKQIRIDYESFKETLVLGLPMGLQGCVISLANVVVQSNINFFGKEAMAGNGAYLKVEGFAFLPITCFTMALTTFISQNAGARAYERVKKGMRFGILCSVFTSELTGALIYLLAAPLITLFNSEPEVVAYGISRAQIVTLFYFLLAFTHCMTAILRSLGHSIAPLVIMLVCWCLIRVSYVTITVHILPDIRVVFWAYPITWLLSSLTLIIFYLWKKPVKVPVKEA